MGIRTVCKHTFQRASLRVSLVLLTTTFGVIGGVASSDATQVSPARSTPLASAASTMSVRLSAHLRLIGRPGHVDNERGTFSGTFSGTIVVRFEAIGSTGGNSTFTMYPSKGGTIVGHSVTHGRVNGAIVNFTGTATITGGTGSWAHASAAGLRYEGALDRQNFHTTSVMSGSVHK